MQTPQILILTILIATVAMFLWGKWRHDMIAMAALLTCVICGLVERTNAFSGFGHPAVITVACVLVLSRALQTSGAIDSITKRLLPASSGPLITIAALTGLGALLSAFMNNVGALALLMPVGIQIANKQNIPPGRVLMPLAFGSILGGMTTLIGTPPNLIVSAARAEAEMGSFGMFDFTPVGIAVALGGILFIILFSGKLVPARERVGAEGFDTGAYMTEATISEDSIAVGKSLREIGKELTAADAQVVGLVRNNFKVSAPNPGRILKAGDILVIEALPEALPTVLSSLKLKLVDDIDNQKAEDEPSSETEDEITKSKDENPTKKSSFDSGEVTLIELAVRPDAALVGRSATDIELRTRFGINLLALSRQGRRSVSRLRSERFKAGDVLLMQGVPESILGFSNEFGCVPLAERSLRIPQKKQAITSAIIMLAAVGGAAFGLMPAAIAFAFGVLACMAFKVVSLKNVYDAVDWPVIVLLAALIPVAGAMATTGTADLIARFLLENVARGNAIVSLAMILIVTMTLSDFMNNAATAAVMCPIAISSAALLSARPDSFLMAVAIGASCAFLTPIGHQNNTLILGPGGFRFGDYWKLGLPLEILVVAISIPMLLWVWPL